MDFKKVLSGTILSFLIGSSFTAQALDRPAPGLDVEEGEVPILSPKQLSKQMKDFKKYLNKVQRCLFTGPCTKEEKAQVWRHGKRLMKYVALAVGARLAYKYRRSIFAIPGQIRGRLHQEAAGVGKAAAAAAGLDTSPGAPSPKEQLTEIVGVAAEEAMTKAGFEVPGTPVIGPTYTPSVVPPLKTQLTEFAGAAAGAAVEKAVAGMEGVSARLHYTGALGTWPERVTLERATPSSSAAAAAAAAGESLSASQFEQLERQEVLDAIQAIQAKEQEVSRGVTKTSLKSAAEAIRAVARARVAAVQRVQLSREGQDRAMRAIRAEVIAAVERVEAAVRGAARAAAEVGAIEAAAAEMKEEEEEEQE